MKEKAKLLIILFALVNSSVWAQNQENMKPEILKLRDNKVEINYYHQGQGDTTLLFLHGWCINSSYWENQLSHFSNNYKVYALDLPGFGKSTAKREDWTIQEYATDINEFIETLNLENVVIVGHSMAGEIMIQAALSKNPNIIGLIGVDNFKHVDVEFSPEEMEQMSGMLTMLKQDFENTVVVFAENWLLHPSTPAEVKERIKNDFTAVNPIVGENALKNLMQFSELTPAILEKQEHKLYLINSDANPTNEVGLKNRCKNGYEIKTIHSTGHYPMIEKPLEFNQLLDEILKNLN